MTRFEPCVYSPLTVHRTLIDEYLLEVHLFLMATFGSNRRFSQSRSAAPVAKVVPARALSRFLLTALIASATAIGLWSLRYLLPSQPQAIHFENFTDRHTAFTIHAVFASIALLAGPWQFLPSIFSRRRQLHRLLGWIYVSTVALGWLASLPLALHAHTGATASAGCAAFTRMDAFLPRPRLSSIVASRTSPELFRP